MRLLDKFFNKFKNVSENEENNVDLTSTITSDWIKSIEPLNEAIPTIDSNIDLQGYNVDGIDDPETICIRRAHIDTRDPEYINIDKHYVELLEKQIGKLEKQKIKLLKTKNYKLTDAIEKVISESEIELTARQIYNRIEKNRLRNKNSTMASVRPILYYLIRRKKIRNGLTRGTFAPI